MKSALLIFELYIISYSVLKYRLLSRDLSQPIFAELLWEWDARNKSQSVFENHRRYPIIPLR